MTHAPDPEAPTPGPGPEDRAALRALIAAELDAPAPAAAQAHAARLAARPGTAAILFYGAMMRDETASGLLDLYVLTDGDRAWHGPGLAALANRLLPPNVLHAPAAEGRPGAKIAVLSLSAFARRMRPRSRDTTLWARFAQPVRLVWARDAQARAAVIEALAEAISTAGGWARVLTPEGAEPEAAWSALFRATYGAELRVEKGDRSRLLVEAAPERYRRLHALLIAGPAPAPAQRAAARRAWARRRAAGKALNLVRLAKAAFTFRGGVAYIVDKIERHSGAPLPLKPWQRRLPWLAAPGIILRLLREKRLR